MNLEQILVVICFIESFVCGIEESLGEADVIDYLEGMKVPDFQAEVIQRDTTFQYSLTNYTVSNVLKLGTSTNVDLESDAFNLKVHFPLVSSTGYMSSLFIVNDYKTHKYEMKGIFTVHANNSTLLIQFLIPKIESEKNTTLIMTECSATYEEIAMELDAKTIKDPLDMGAMNKWLSKALHTTLSELYCIGLRADLEKGAFSSIFQSILGVISDAIPSG